MLVFTQYYLSCLSHASYLVGDTTTGRAVVVDPRRDIDVYLDDAATNGLRIERVIETHVHADFVSGHLELAARTGAVISYGAGAEVAYPVDLLHDGQRLAIGEVVLEVLATPGHTPESICVVVYERDGEPPYGVLTGDTLFVGDVGRPDLVAAGGAGHSPDAMARLLHRSLRDKLLPLPDATQVFPAHGAGSSCGRQLSSETSSTIGEQRRSNYTLQPMDEDAFVAMVNEAQPVRPPYFAFDAQRNREDHPLLDETAPPLVGIEEVLARAAAGAALLDVREPSAFAAAHLRDAVNIGLQGRFAEWAGDLLPDDGDIVLVGDPTTAVEAKVRLGRIGYDRVVAQLDDPGTVLAQRPDLHTSSSRLTPEQFAELRNLEPDLQLVDVRGPGETALGTLARAREVPLPALTASLTGLDPAAPVVVYCASGYRSQVAASVLARAGFADVSDLLGGFAAWEAAGLPVTAMGAAEDAGDVPQVGPRVAQAMVERGATLLDVREADEWQGGHAPGAVLMPMSQVHGRRHELPGSRPVVVVCRSGGRSATITQALRAEGLDAHNLAGGMCAWSAAALPVVTPEVDTSRLVIHKREPLNGETSLDALIGGVAMPSTRFYVRNHFDIPRIDPATWALGVGGRVERPLRLDLRDLRRMRSHTALVTLECAGNGRTTFDPPVDGEPWRLGAVSTAEWTGVPLAEVLERAAPTSDAVEVLFRAADRAASGAAGPATFDRSLPLADAYGSGALLAYAMNGDPLPPEHGFPLRLVVPSWYAVASVKWLTTIEVLAEPFEGWFQTERYVMERDGADGPHVEPLRHQRVRALITEPADGPEVPLGELAVRGVAWSGEAPIERVDVMVGDGPWQAARLIGEPQPGCWQWWELLTCVERPGEVTVRARATDQAGRTQPERPEWNRLGYCGNAIQVVTLRIG